MFSWLALTHKFAALQMVLLGLQFATSQGCATHRALGRHTASVSATLSDIYYQQVLDNIARFVVNPTTMPSFAIVNAGTVNLQDQYGANISPTYSPTLSRAMQGGGALPILSILFGVSGQRALTENWSTTPVTDSDNMRRMRCAFQRAVGLAESECDNCKPRLDGFFLGGTETLKCALPIGWYQVGHEKDVPANACYVSHFCDTYVWVSRDDLDDFTRFTITVMDIATGEIHAPQRSVVKKYKGDIKLDNLESTEVTVTETDVDALKKNSGFGTDRQRYELPSMNRGLFFVPR